MKKIFGGLLLLGAALADGGSSASRVARDAAAISGVIVLKNGIDQGKEAKINREALRELVASLDAELEPVLVEIDGQTVRLEGSAEAQYAEWRRMLGRIFTTETGFSSDPDADVSHERADGSED
jgi:sulfur carrier protein ThiS